MVYIFAIVGLSIDFIYLLELLQLKKRERKRKQDEAEALGEDAPPRQVPQTLDTLREHDPTFVDVDNPAEDINVDEFASYFSKTYVPKILITSSANPNLVIIFSDKLYNSRLMGRRKPSIGLYTFIFYF